MSNNEKSTHLINILSDLLDGQRLSSIDIKASNSNQYFCTIKNNGIELIEVRNPLKFKDILVINNKYLKNEE